MTTSPSRRLVSKWVVEHICPLCNDKWCENHWPARNGLRWHQSCLAALEAQGFHPSPMAIFERIKCPHCGGSGKKRTDLFRSCDHCNGYKFRFKRKSVLVLLAECAD